MAGTRVCCALLTAALWLAALPCNAAAPVTTDDLPLDGSVPAPELAARLLTKVYGGVDKQRNCRVAAAAGNQYCMTLDRVDTVTA